MCIRDSITIDLWCGNGKRTHGDGKMKVGHQMANMCGGRAMQPNLRNVPFVIDPFAFKKVDAVLATHYHQDHMSAEWAAHVINSGMTTTDENGKEIPVPVSYTHLTGRWDSVLLDIFGIEKNKLCDLIDPGELHGYTNEKFAESTRLKTGIPVYSAGGDQQCSALGMGIYEEGDMEVTSGTGAFIIGITEKVPIVLMGNPIINYSAVKGKYIVEASILTCSAAFDWFCNNFYKEVQGDIYPVSDTQLQPAWCVV